MIEAFRLGIVPHDCINEFTFGRNSETKELLSWLDSPAASTLLLIGEYGTGKSHLLHYAYSRALHEGFAVALVDMDPNEAPFRKPKRVYRRLVQTFKYLPERHAPAKGFRDFVRAILAEGALRRDEYFGHLTSTTTDEKLWDWIEGQEAAVRPWDPRYEGRYSHLPGLYDYSTAVNVYCHLLSTLGWAAVQILGLKGLLLLFDEAEGIGVYDYAYQEEKNHLFLKALIRTAASDERLLGSPWKTSLDYCGYASRVPFLHQSPSGLKLLFAFTSLEWNYVHYWGQRVGDPRVPELQSATELELEPLSDEALQEVFREICLRYDSAYDFLEGDLTISHIFDHIASRAGRTRLFVKGAVEALDLVRLNHGRSLDEVLQ